MMIHASLHRFVTTDIAGSGKLFVLQLNNRVLLKTMNQGMRPAEIKSEITLSTTSTRTVCVPYNRRDRSSPSRVSWISISMVIDQLIAHVEHACAARARCRYILWHNVDRLASPDRKEPSHDQRLDPVLSSPKVPSFSLKQRVLEPRRVNNCARI
jgi:hypothetical protein